MKKGNGKNPTSGSHLGFEATLWATADKLRGNLDAAEYKHVAFWGSSFSNTAALLETLPPKLLSGELRVPTTQKGKATHEKSVEGSS